MATGTSTSQMSSLANPHQYKIITQDDRELYRNDPVLVPLTGSENGSSVIVANDFDWGDDIFAHTAAGTNHLRTARWYLCSPGRCDDCNSIRCD